MKTGGNVLSKNKAKNKNTLYYHVKEQEPIKSWEDSKTKKKNTQIERTIVCVVSLDSNQTTFAGEEGGKKDLWSFTVC